MLVAEVCRLAARPLAWPVSSVVSSCAALSTVNEPALPATHLAGPYYIQQHTPAGISPELLLLHCCVPYMSLPG